MSAAAPIAHINLLERTGPSYTAALALLGSTALAIAGIAWYGLALQADALEATQARDKAGLAVKQVTEQIAAKDSEQARSARSQALRKEIEALQPQAQAAQALADALQTAAGGRTDEFERPLKAVTALAEPGLWLTGLTLGENGKRLELLGEAHNGSAVLRYARRANEALQPLAVRLESVEMQPASATAAAAAAGVAAASAGVTFKLF